MRVPELSSLLLLSSAFFVDLATTAPTSLTLAAPLLCWTGSTPQKGSWTYCQPSEECFNDHYNGVFGCKDRGYCSVNGLEQDECFSVSTAWEACCCATSGCNNLQQLVPTGTVSIVTSTPTTTLVPTPPSGETFPPTVVCWSGTNERNGDWVSCQPFEECYNDVHGGVFDCRARDSCSKSQLEQDECFVLSTLWEPCCCASDGCNNPGYPVPARSTPPAQLCPEGWIPSQTHKNKCYLSLSQEKTFADAESACRGQDKRAEVVTIMSGFANSEVRDLAVKGGVWLGLTQVNGDWQWEGGVSVVYLNWAPGEPRGEGDCALLGKSGKWQATSCTQRLFTICE